MAHYAETAGTWLRDGKDYAKTATNARRQPHRINLESPCKLGVNCVISSQLVMPACPICSREVPQQLLNQVSIIAAFDVNGLPGFVAVLLVGYPPEFRGDVARPGFCVCCVSQHVNRCLDNSGSGGNPGRGRSPGRSPRRQPKRDVTQAEADEAKLRSYFSDQWRSERSAIERIQREKDSKQPVYTGVLGAGAARPGILFVKGT